MKYLLIFLILSSVTYYEKMITANENIQYFNLPTECSKKSIGVFLQDCYVEDYPNKLKCPQSHPFIWLKYYFSRETPAQSSKYGRLVCCQQKICCNQPVEELVVFN